MKFKRGDYFIDEDNDIGFIKRVGRINYTYNWILLDGFEVTSGSNHTISIKEVQHNSEWTLLDDTEKARLV